MMTWPFGLFLVIGSFLLTVFLTPLAARMAVRADALDLPTHRKRHGRIMPLWGGFGLWLSMMIMIGLSWMLSPSLQTILKASKYHWLLVGFVCGSTIVTLLGMADDRWGVPPKLKLFGQFVAAAVTVWFGVRVVGFVDPFFQKYLVMPFWLGSALAFLWIVLMINAVNFIDGLDGLASGIGMISAIAFFLVAANTLPLSTLAVKGALNLSAWLSLLLAGGLAGFLLFNFHPARIFLGDSGSMLIGHALACIALIGSMKSTMVFTTVVPVLIMALPLADVIWAIARRLKEGQPISKSDKGHVHHRLLAFGLSHRGVVLSLYAFNGACAAIAVWLSL